MPNGEIAFWRAILDLPGKHEQKARLWNGYIGWKLPPGLRGETPRNGWPHYVVHAPPGGWPELTEDERSVLENLAQEYGGHPTWRERTYMDFVGSSFESEVNLSDLTLIDADFSKARFHAGVQLEGSRFFMQACFSGTNFEAGARFHKTFFEADVHFNHVQFRGFALFESVEFNGGATFDRAGFESYVRFNDSKFVETHFSGGISVLNLASFKGVHFRGGASFRNVVFGEDPTRTVKRHRPRRLADFSDARFDAATDFRRAVFNGPPAFFNCRLHEDTDFSRVEWPKAMPEPREIEYAIRAWERLELMMSQLEKPLDRHRFFRFKMRARRLADGRFLRVINYLFEFTSDYGWSVKRASLSWVAHWLVAGFVLFSNARQAGFGGDTLKLFIAALGTAFANAHAFLSLAGPGGYLEGGRLLIEQHVHGGLLAIIGVTQAVLGPVLLFVLLLTLRNRFRLA
ncbi:MAG: pentapeptide repeat-containing protein [Acidobacteriia bacterium]|nr:pentapeptide repeat-containing protein [Terriglobia bacterium]